MNPEALDVLIEANVVRRIDNDPNETHAEKDMVFYFNTEQDLRAQHAALIHSPVGMIFDDVLWNADQYSGLFEIKSNARIFFKWHFVYRP